MPDASAAAENALEKAAKKRNPIERLLVWGGIGALLVVMGIEARAQQGYSKSLQALQDALSDDSVLLPLNDARSLMAFGPSESDPEVGQFDQKVTFSWFSIFKSGEYQIVITAGSGDNPDVLTYSTSVADTSLELPPLTEHPGSSGNPFGYDSSNATPPPGGGAEDGHDAEGGGFGPGAGGGGPGAGGGFGPGAGFGPPPPDKLVTALDTDEDGEVSAEELENAVAALQGLDENGDGSLTRDEVLPPRRFPGGGFPGGGGNRGPEAENRPQRPEIDDEE